MLVRERDLGELLLAEHPVRGVRWLHGVGQPFCLMVPPAVGVSRHGTCRQRRPGFPSADDLLVLNCCLRRGGITPLTQRTA